MYFCEIIDGLVKVENHRKTVIPACPESFFFSVLYGNTIPEVRE
jgi:hypothetical protein